MKSTEFTLPNAGARLAGSLQLRMLGTKKINEIFKPTSGFMYSVIWTSTAEKQGDGYTSEWVEWCKSEMPEWLNDKGILYKVNSNAKILSMNTDKDAFKIAKHYGIELPNDHTDILMMIKKFPWDDIKDDYDGIHHNPTGSRLANMLMSSWDVESTAWFNTNHLQNLGEVSVSL